MRLGFQYLGVWLSKRQLCIDHMTISRLCVPKYATGLSEGMFPLLLRVVCHSIATVLVSFPDVWCAGGSGDTPLSLVPVEGYYGPNCPLVLQAACLH